MTLTLVTGGGGFVGGHVAAALLARGERVRVLDLDPAGAPAGAEAVAGSILDPAALASAVAGADAVIHAAALAALWVPRAADVDRVNRAGAEAVFAAARRVGARVVHVSSFTTLVGGPPRTAALDESVELPPEAMLGPYPRAKRAAELAALASGADVVIALPSAPVGPGDRRLTPPTRLIRDLARGALPALVEAPINLIDVGALAEGLIRARDRGRSGRRYLLCGGDISIGDLAEKVAALTGAPAPRVRVPMALALAAARVEAGVAAITGRAPAAPLTGVRIAARRPRFDGRRAREELGFAAPDIDAALKATVRWLAATAGTREGGEIAQDRRDAGRDRGIW
jgi:dihydroflavonol-4-reductase